MTPEMAGDREVELAPEWGESDPEWNQIHPDLLFAVIIDLLVDMDAGEYI